MDCPSARWHLPGPIAHVQPLEIVVVNTSAGARYGCNDYVSSGCRMERDATPAQPGHQGRRHGWVALGRTIRSYIKTFWRDSACEPDLGRP